MSKITTTKLNSLPQQVEENRKNINTLGSEVDNANTSIESLKTRTTTLEGKFPISTNNIAESAITSSKVATSAITTDKVASKAITKDKIADGVLPDSCKNAFIGNCDVLCSDGAIRNFGVYIKTTMNTMNDRETDPSDFLAALSSILLENVFTSEGGNELTIFGFDGISIYKNSDATNSVYYSHKTSSGIYTETLTTTNILNCSYIILPC